MQCRAHWCWIWCVSVWTQSHLFCCESAGNHEYDYRTGKERHRSHTHSKDPSGASTPYDPDWGNYGMLALIPCSYGCRYGMCALISCSYRCSYGMLALITCSYRCSYGMHALITCCTANAAPGCTSGSQSMMLLSELSICTMLSVVHSSLCLPC